ncbi:electron transport complex subunit RsxC [Paraglaciecola sp.]|uniref:electron transport complex subunit RsxC n=1 Tax=Paraglaciecola sp. TaxID=1920173 RepID=UPI003EF0D9D8
MHTSFDQIVHKLDQEELWDFPGGIHPPERKDISNQKPIANLPIAKTLYVTVKQHKGVEGNIIVEAGQQVLKGQALTKSANPFAVPIHAPTSGTVKAIDKHVSPHPSGIPELTIEIESDDQDTWGELSPMMDYQDQPKIEVLGKICDAGISGMGGAGFPSHIKLSTDKEVEFLIINGVECEPYITADDRLMREHAWQIRQGIDVLTHLVSPKQVIIAIENNKPEALEAMQTACRENPLYKVVEVPTKYPSGGEKQLIQILTGREVPAQGLPIDVGVISQNVGTCYAIADAIFSGKPLIQRVTTVTGEALEKPSNYWTLIGTPLKHLLEQCDYLEETQKQPRVIIGGPMMGFTATNELVPVIKTSNCVLVPADKEMAELDEQACIRCGACADVCPAGLLPQQMFWHAKAKELDKVQEYNLFDCIECGACAYVCPSEIPLVHYYRVAKAEIRNEQDEKQQADKARERFEKRAARLLAEQAARDEKHRLAAEARKQAMESRGSNAKDKIAAALARAKAKKQALSASQENTVSESDTKDVAEQQGSNPSTELETQVAGTDSPTDTTADTPADAPADKETGASADKTTAKKPASSNQRVQAAIARAKAKKAAAAQTAKNNEEPASESLSNNENETLKSKKHLGSQTGAIIEPKSIAPNTSAKESKSKETELDPSSSKAADVKQARVAAAVAKAKAKRAKQKTSEQANTIEPSDKPSNEPSETAQAPTPAAEKNQDEKAVDQTQETQTPVQEEASTDAKNDALAIKKRRIAQAVAKAKAKRQTEKAQAEKAQIEKEQVKKEDKPS